MPDDVLLLRGERLKARIGFAIAAKTVFRTIEIAVVRRSGGKAEGEVVRTTRIPLSVAQNPGDILEGDIGHAYGGSIICKSLSLQADIKTRKD